MRVPIRRRFGRVQCEKRMVSSVSPAVLCGVYFCATLAHPLAVQSFQNIGHIDFKNDRCLLLSPNGRHGICMICFEAHASCVGYHVLLLYTDVIFFHLVTRQVKIQTYCRSSSDGCVKSCCGFRVLDVSKWATIFVMACFAVASCCPLICSLRNSRLLRKQRLSYMNVLTSLYERDSFFTKIIASQVVRIPLLPSADT